MRVYARCGRWLTHSFFRCALRSRVYFLVYVNKLWAKWNKKKDSQLRANTIVFGSVIIGIGFVSADKPATCKHKASIINLIDAHEYAKYTTVLVIIAAKPFSISTTQTS